MKKNVYPSKQTVNLVVYEKNMSSPSRAIPAFCLFLAVLALFVKLAVLNPLEDLMAAQASLDQVISDISGYREYNQDYAQVEEQYNQYFSTYLEEGEVDLTDRIQVLDLLQQQVMNQATLQTLSIRENLCRIVITDIQLNAVSQLVAVLEESPLVEYITVSTAATDQKDQNQERAAVPAGLQMVTADLTITLTGGNDNAE